MQKTITPLLFGLLLLSAALTGQSVEPFDYEPGQNLEGLSGGSGWLAGWSVLKGNDEASTAEGSITVEDGGQTGGDNHLFVQHTAGAPGIRAARLLEAPVTDDGNTYYVSWFQDNDYEDPSTNGSAAQVMLINNVALAAGGPSGQLVRMGRLFNTSKFGIDGIRVATDTIEDTDTREAALIVVAISFSGNEERETLSFFINPDTTATTLDTAMADFTTTAELNTGFDALGFKVEGGAEMNTRLDALRFGSSVSDVLGPIVVTPPTEAAFATETFNTYTVGDTLGSLTGGSGWAGGWMAMPSSDNSVILGSGLLNDTLSVGTSGNSLRIMADGELERSLRIFANPLDTTDNPDFWFSAQLASGGGPAGTVGNFILVDTTQPNFQQVIIGKQFGNQNIFAVGDGQAGGASQTGRQFSGSGSSLIVGHMVRNDGGWDMDLYVDPDPNATELEEDSAQIIDKRYTSGNFNGVAVRIDGTGTELIFDVDDIYFGESYTDVIPDDLTSSTPAPPGAAERFDYEAGELLIGQEGGGSGWTGPWLRLTDTGDGMIEEEGISSPALLQATGGPSVRLDSYVRAVRGLQGTYGDVGREFWIGWWFDVDDAGDNVAHLVLADTATFVDTGGEGQLAQIGKLFGGATIGVVAPQGGQAAGSDAEEGHFMVAQIVTNGTAAADDINVWIDPDLSAAPSADTADIVAAADLTNWNGIGLKFEGAEGTQTTAAFDDIIVGFGFNEVIPNGLVPLDPPNTPRAAVEVFDYEAGGDLNGADGGEGWRGPWQAISGTAVIAESNVESPLTCPEGVSATVTQSGADTPTVYRREFFNPFGLGDATTFYASFVLNGVAKDIGNSAQVSFVSGENNVLAIGGVPGLSSLSVLRNDDRVPQTSSTEVITGTKWFVVRMDIDSVTRLATARVFIDPLADAIPANESASFTVENVSLLDGITGIEISGEGAQTVELAVDDIRAGFSYRDISCQFGSDDPNLLAYEPFNYDANTSLNAAGGENAFWTGPWTTPASIGANTAIILEGSLEQQGLADEANRAEFTFTDPDNNLRLDRELAFPIESNDSTYWISFLMNTADPSAVDNVANLTLLNGTDNRFVIGKLFGNGGQLGTVVVGGSARRTEVVDGGQHWFVTRIQTAAQADVDTVTLWIDPPASASAPDTTTAGFEQYFNTPVFKQPMTGVRLRIEGNAAPYSTQFDELRIATAWSSIVNITNAIVPIAEDPLKLAAFPNPFSNELTVTYELPENGRVLLQLLDINGRILRSLPAGNGGGLGRTILNGSTLQGLANGFYFLRVSQNGRSSTRKLVLSR